MTVDWKAQRDAMNSALAGATAVQVQLAKPILVRLRQIGSKYDELFPPDPAPDTPTTLTESAAHQEWREDMEALILGLHAFAAAVDGGVVPETIELHTISAWDAVMARLANASHLPTASDGARALCVRARENVWRTPEPRYFVDTYYADGGTNEIVGVYEKMMVDILAEVALWLDVVDPEEE